MNSVQQSLTTFYQYIVHVMHRRFCVQHPDRFQICIIIMLLSGNVNFWISCEQVWGHHVTLPL